MRVNLNLPVKSEAKQETETTLVNVESDRRLIVQVSALHPTYNHYYQNYLDGSMPYFDAIRMCVCVFKTISLTASYHSV